MRTLTVLLKYVTVGNVPLFSFAGAQCTFFSVKFDLLSEIAQSCQFSIIPN